jgi:hypothetical protein
VNDFAPTGSPGIDALLRVAQTLAQQPELKEGLQFSRHVEEMQSFRRALEKQFRDSLRFYPRSPLWEKLQTQLDQAFELFRGGGRRLENFLEVARVDDLSTGCQRVHQAVTQLQALAAQLRAQEEVWQRGLEPGLAGELKFFIGQTLQGHLSHQQAALALEKSLEACRSLELAMGKVLPENDGVSEALDRCTVHLAKFSRSLQRALQSLRMQHSWEIDECLQDLLDSVEELAVSHQGLMQSLYPPVICPRCGQQQPGDRPQCGSCSARLPLPALSVLPPPPSPELRPRFQSFVEVEGKLEMWLRGEVETPVCEMAIDQFRQRLSLGRRQMERDTALDTELKELMVRAASISEEALASLKTSLHNQDQKACQRDLEGLRTAEELMNQAQEKAQQLQSTPNS